MHVEQFLHRDLGCASYLIADGGEAIVVDPRWEVDAYLEAAARLGARIAHVLETHDHADHVSGRGRLTRRTGARGYRPGRELSAGGTLRVGQVRVTALATPGHRPEHLAFTVADTARSDEPIAVLAGDSLLVGDVARPDLAVDPVDGARELHASLRAILALGDHVELWPGHIGGSLCGGAGLSPKTSSTVGIERRCSPRLRLDASAFVDDLTAQSVARPPHLARVASLNAGELADEPERAPLLHAGALGALLRDGATVLDGRDAVSFDGGHLAGSIVLPLGSNGIGSRAGWAVGDPAAPLVLVGADEDAARTLASLLASVGLWNVRGLAVADPAGWARAGLDVRRATALDVVGFAAGLRAGARHLVDVRDPGEYASAHVAGSTSLPLSRLADGRDAAAPRRPLVVACAGGARAAIGASILRRAGHRDVVRVAGGGIRDLADHGVALV